MWVLGINWKWHDSSAALVDSAGHVWALAEEERFTRVKHAWETFPRHAVRHCLDTAGIGWRELGRVAIGFDLPRAGAWSPDSRDELFSAIFGPESVAAPGPEVVFVEHHLAHALSAYHASGFERSGVLVVDGAGERESASVYAADHGELTLKRQWSRSFSLGAMYEAATRLLGFGYLDAGKTMGLAPYASPADAVAVPVEGRVAGGAWQDVPIADLPPDAPYDRVADRWVEYLTGVYGEVRHEPALLHTDPVAVRIAAGVQRTVEEHLLALHAETVRLSGSGAVCLAGGVTLNCVANGRLPEPVYVLPVPHDAGVALGAAWSVCPPVKAALLESPYLGTELRAGTEIDRLREEGFGVRDFTPDAVVGLLGDGAVGAVAEGRAEVGPRALGHRSIVALPAPVAVRDEINRRKGRERWRPLAPVTLPSYAGKLWPSQGLRELYMIGTARVSEHAEQVMPAAAHVDGTTRPQVLPAGQAPVLESLLDGFEAAGLPPVLVNTSLNGRGEPIADSAADVARCFRGLGLDFVVLGGQLVRPPR